MSHDKMKVALVISSLTPGGAERMISTMANYWARKGWTVTIVTMDNGVTPPFYDLDVRVSRFFLNTAKESSGLISAVWNNLRRVFALRRAILENKPDAVISFVDKTNVITLLATLGLKPKVIVSERTDPYMYRIGQAWDRLRWWTYSSAEHIVVQTRGALGYFLPKFEAQLTVIPNPVVAPPARERLNATTHLHPSIISMGRFSHEKGFDILLRAFGRLKDHHPEWTVTIFGEGLLRSELESLRDSLGLAGRVQLPGCVKNTYEYLSRATLFVMSSRFEGFPNALCEAMACGLPVIATDCSSGPREIIRDGKDGVLVRPNDVDALASAMEVLMTDESARNRLGRRAGEVTSRFSIERVMKMWEDVLS